MKVGVFSILPDAAADPAVVAAHAEALGFASYWVPDHVILPVRYSTPYPGNLDGGPDPDYLWQMPDPMIALMRAATATRTIEVGTGVLLVPERHPLHLAKEIASLDAYSGGRFHFGKIRLRAEHRQHLLKILHVVGAQIDHAAGPQRARGQRGESLVDEPVLAVLHLRPRVGKINVDGLRARGRQQVFEEVADLDAHEAEVREAEAAADFVRLADAPEQALDAEEVPRRILSRPLDEEGAVAAAEFNFER